MPTLSRMLAGSMTASDELQIARVHSLLGTDGFIEFFGVAPPSSSCCAGKNSPSLYVLGADPVDCIAGIAFSLTRRIIGSVSSSSPLAQGGLSDIATSIYQPRDLPPALWRATNPNTQISATVATLVANALRIARGTFSVTGASLAAVLKPFFPSEVTSVSNLLGEAIYGSADSTPAYSAPQDATLLLPKILDVDTAPGAILEMVQGSDGIYSVS